MSEFDPDVTMALKRASPLWAWVRKNLTLNVAIALLLSLLGTSSTAIWQFHELRTDVTALKDEFKASKAQGEAIAALNARVEGLEELEKGRRAWVDQTYAQLPPSRLRRKPRE